MKAYPAGSALVFTGLALIISLVSCSPKCVVRGRVVDAETRQPIQGAAVAIRWYSENPGQPSAKAETVDAVQALSMTEAYSRFRSILTSSIFSGSINPATSAGAVETFF